MIETLPDFSRALDPTDARVYADHDHTYYNSQGYRRLRGYNRLTALDPTFAPACLKGILLAGIGKPRKALPYFEQAARLHSTQAQQAIPQTQQILGGALQV